MQISKESLSGYILEEVLAYLIRTTGYELLVDPKQDPRELDRRGNGLVIKGRGAVHQVDVLGELKWIPAFTFPLRLIVEAKFRKNKTGIDIVRNAVSVVLDVNQNNSPTWEQKIFSPKYQYVYAIFSTSGFTKPAMDLAIAHQISLIDLSVSEYAQLRDAIERAASDILKIDNREQKIDNREQLVSRLRNTLRKKLGTFPEHLDVNGSLELPDSYCRYLDPVISTAKEEYKELFVGMANGPFMLLLKSNNPDRFLNFAKQRPSHRVSITWSYPENKVWRIGPADAPDEYELSFKLPERLYKWIFDTEKERKRRALRVKKEYFSNITIYRYERENDYLFRLRFDPEATQKYISRR